MLKAAERGLEAPLGGAPLGGVLKSSGTAKSTSSYIVQGIEQQVGDNA